MEKETPKNMFETQDERQRRTVKMMDEDGYWEIDSPPFALDPHLRNELKRQWENSRNRITK